MTSIIKTAEWTLKDGRPVVFSAELVTSQTIDADGDRVVVDCCEINYETTVGGDIVSHDTPQATSRVDLPSRIGQLGLSADNLAQVNAVIAAIEATPEWRAKLADDARWVRETNEHNANIAKINRCL